MIKECLVDAARAHRAVRALLMAQPSSTTMMALGCGRYQIPLQPSLIFREDGRFVPQTQSFGDLFDELESGRQSDTD
jgi:hypothetical protein